MAIYTRDNINYGGMLANALQSKSNYLKNRYDRVAQMGQNWGNAIANSGKIAQDAIFKLDDQYYNKDKIAQQQEFQASEAEKRALEALERQKQQEEFQKAENKLNRQNTMDIAKLNKEIAADEKKDEYQLHYQKAKSYYDMVSKQAKENKNNTELQRAEADAKFDLDYWAKKAGVNVAATQPTATTPEFSDEFLKETGYKAEPPKPEDSFDNATITKNIDESLGMDPSDWTNDERAKLLEQANKIQEPGLRQQYLTRIKKKGDTVEEKRAAALALKAEAQASYDALPKLANGTVRPGAFTKWKKANPKYAKALGK